MTQRVCMKDSPAVSSSNPKVQNKFIAEHPMTVQNNFIAECPEFRPSIEEFKNFSKYIESVEEKALPFGIMKIIPPAGNQSVKK